LDGAEKYGTKSEIKNLGSIRSVFLGVEFERKRQIAVLDGGGVVEQETRGWNDSNETSFAMRKKEAENDYRYFPDPDLCPMTFTEPRIEEARAALPELPLAKKQRYVEVFGLSEYDAGVLTAERAWAQYFETCAQAGGDPKSICNWMNGDFARLLNESGQTIDPEAGREQSKVSVNHLVELTKLIEKGTISGKIAKTIFEDMFVSGEMPAALVEKSGMTQIADTGAIEAFASEVIAENAAIVEKFKSGQENVMGFLVGQLMKKSQGRANPQLAQEILRNLIG
jgi:aspartyl-tRNA(Asn)/glutamyl-tRNA(Gln) amidotransferase subunit B